MYEKILPNPFLQTLFVSRETSNCPLIAEMIKLGHDLEHLGVADKDTGILSLDYGKRLLINAKNIDVKKMQRNDVVEIVDYDPLKNIMMIIGTKDPCQETPVHWIIQKARHDINALLQIQSEALAEALQGKLPTTEKEKPTTSLDQAKEMLKTLRKGNTILIKKQGVVFAGFNLKEIQDSLHQHLGATK